MNRSQLILFLNQLEQELPVYEWKVEGVNPWPIIRINLAFSNLSDTRKTAQKSSSPVAEQTAHTRSPGILIKWYDRLQKRIAYEKLKREEQKAVQEVKTLFKAPLDILFFTYPMYRVALGQQMFNRFVDPLADALIDQGLHPAILEFNKPPVPFLCANYNSAICRPIDQYLAMEVRHDSIWHKELSVNMPGHNEFVERLKSVEPGFDPSRFMLHSIEKETRYYIAAKNCFIKLLQDQPLKTIFTTTYYGLQNLALIGAANQLGITTVDLQHGVADEFHAAYGRWSNFPDTGHEMLPNIFWTWSDEEAKHINKWAATTGRHKAIIGGNPWLNFWQNDTGNEYAKRLIKDLETTIPPDKTIILYSVQTLPFIDNIIPISVINTIKASPQNWFWLIRLHPNQLKRKEAIVDWLRANNIGNNYEIEMCTTLPLPVVLQKTDLHFTLSSTVTKEAAYFGIPSVMSFEDGKDAFPSELANGIAIFEDYEKGDLITAIKNQLNNREFQELHDSKDYRQVLINILEH